MTARRFPPPWSVDDPDTKLGQDCCIVRDANGQTLAYVYFEEEPGRFSPKTAPVVGFTWWILPHARQVTGS
jgi:hypothetical protein